MEQFWQFLQKSPLNLILFGVAVASGVMLLWPLVTRPFRASFDIGVFEAVQFINRRDAVVLDVRGTGDYEAGHIAHARHVPEAQLSDRMKELEKFRNRTLIVCCGTGSRSGTVAGGLRKKGFAETYALRGGIAAWQQAGMPLEKS